MFDQKDADRFWSLVDMSGGADACWIFQQRWAFSAAAIGGKMRQWPPHCIAYILTYGPLENGLVVRHLCEATSSHSYTCVNPRHLRKGTQAENIWDRTVRQLFEFAPGELVGYEEVPEWIPPPFRK
jgi:hypothetical protein